MDIDIRRTRGLVLGLGNLIFQDEGFGIHLLRVLQSQFGGNARSDLEFLDGGVLGLDLLPLIEESTHLLVLDVVNADRPPGTVVELSGDEIPLFAGVKLSEHQLTFQEVLGLAHVRQRLPQHLHLIGVQPQTLGVGTELTPVVAKSLPEAAKRAVRVLVSWGLLADPPR